MIVVDTNILAYLLLPTPRTDEAESRYARDPRRRFGARNFATSC
ncbi:hypothetical protein [Thiohalocapsa marina]|nr:hypothetical protein [Thiohalocapsa marina]